jgi:hypothetical protein
VITDKIKLQYRKYGRFKLCSCEVYDCPTVVEKKRKVQA